MRAWAALSSLEQDLLLDLELVLVLVLLDLLLGELLLGNLDPLLLAGDCALSLLLSTGGSGGGGAVLPGAFLCAPSAGCTGCTFQQRLSSSATFL